MGDGIFSDILRIDLLREIKLNPKDSNKNDIIGGLLHVLKYSSMDRKDLAIVTDINEGAEKPPF